MNWKKQVFENFKLYAITDLKSPDPSWVEKIAAAFRGGADIVQLRSKTLSDRELYALGLQIRELANSYKKLFFVNDRLDLALAVEADGIHLGQEDLPIAAVRRICQQARYSLCIGKSTHSLEQAVAAEKEGANYVGVGPIFGTPTKPDYQPVGLGLIRKVQAAVKIPFVAIGGIDETNLASVLEAGASRIALVRAIFGAEDIYEAAKKLREQIEKQESLRA
jgi:thiamine-phosphate pyrophosphorylase